MLPLCFCTCCFFACALAGECACLQLARILWLLALRYSLVLDMAVYVVSSLLRPDGTVQTTSQVTLDQFPSFINGNEVQLFVQTHSLGASAKCPNPQFFAQYPGDAGPDFRSLTSSSPILS